jgi:hypothetical protein
MTPVATMKTVTPEDDYLSRTGFSTLISSISILPGQQIKNGDTESQNNVEPSNQPISNQRCIADYNTKVGDPLCCGQHARLTQNDNYFVCPASKPTCSGFELNKSWGTCN